MADAPVMLITGASSGIGEATARAAVEAGYCVALGARSEDRLNALVGELGPQRALALRCDVTDWEQQQALVSAALERFGRLDAVFANAGYGARRGFTEESVEHWRAMIETNVLGPALTIRATLPHLLEAGSGHYLLTGSVAGRRALAGSLYSATKWAVTGMGEALRQELRQNHLEAGIRVTLIEPGIVDTPFFDQPPEFGLTSDDIARTVLWVLAQPPHMDVNEVLVRPTRQAS